MPLLIATHRSLEFYYAVSLSSMAWAAEMHAIELGIWSSLTTLKPVWSRRGRVFSPKWQSANVVEDAKERDRIF